MTAAARLAGGALVLIAYAWALKPSPAAVAPVANGSATDVERWLAVSNDAYAAGRYADALEATSRLVTRFPTQQAYAERLARISGKLNRAADEAAAMTIPRTSTVVRFMHAPPGARTKASADTAAIRRAPPG